MAGAAYSRSDEPIGAQKPGRSREPALAGGSAGLARLLKTGVFTAKGEPGDSACAWGRSRDQRANQKAKRRRIGLGTGNDCRRAGCHSGNIREFREHAHGSGGNIVVTSWLLPVVR